MYNCDLNIAFNLPNTKGTLSREDGGHCAIGKMFAGCLGRPLTGVNNGKQWDDKEVELLHTEFMLALLDKFHSNKPYVEIYQTQDDFDQPERALRLALQYGEESGFCRPTNVLKPANVFE